MQDINQVLQQNSFQVKQLLRRSRIVGEPNIESIQRGFEKGGEPFMMKLLQIITPTEASFTALIQPKSAVLSTGLDTKTLMPMKTTVATGTAATGKVWTFWENLLSGISATGETIGKFKADATAAVPDATITPEQAATTANNTKMLYYAAGAFGVLIILILILRK